MLLGIEKKKKEEEEEVESKYSLRSELNEIDNRGLRTSESCKDVDMVSELPGCSNPSVVMEALASDASTDPRTKEQKNVVNSRIRSHEDGSLDYESGYDSASIPSPAFEFQKAERAAPHRVPFSSLTKPAPSKWDDAQK